jgi:error-prone DNA polymerase
VRDGWLPDVTRVVDPLLDFPAQTVSEELDLDRQSTGTTPGRHVLMHLRERLTARGSITAAELIKLPNGTAACLAGQMVVRQRPPTAGGLVFLSISDETGMANVTLGATVYERDRMVVRGEALLWVEGIVERRYGSAAIRAERVLALRVALRAPA